MRNSKETVITVFIILLAGGAIVAGTLFVKQEEQQPQKTTTEKEQSQAQDKDTEQVAKTECSQYVGETEKILENAFGDAEKINFGAEGKYSEKLERCVVDALVLGNQDGKYFESKLIFDSRNNDIIAEYTKWGSDLLSDLTEKEFMELEREVLYDL